MAEKLILVGRVAGAFGVKGETRITAYTADPMALTDYGPLLRKSGAPGLTVQSARPAKGGIVALLGATVAALRLLLMISLLAMFP